MDKKNFITTAELAKILGISRVAVFKRIKGGKIKAVKAGRNFIIDEKDLSGILEKTLSDNKKREIKGAVDKVINDYGETLKLLGRE
ncbi:helix-turn-helix domain-containing protein [Candidatus Falkowbacteria bacterium]|nr:helix-turn-helix domain-containing protein [Candidatus Falkowbacteria bacterium]